MDWLCPRSSPDEIKVKGLETHNIVEGVSYCVLIHTFMIRKKDTLSHRNKLQDNVLFSFGFVSSTFQPSSKVFRNSVCLSVRDLTPVLTIRLPWNGYIGCWAFLGQCSVLKRKRVVFSVHAQDHPKEFRLWGKAFAVHMALF